MRRTLALATCLLLAGCGDKPTPKEYGGTVPLGKPGGPLIVAVGDSLTSGFPLYDPDPATRGTLERVDARSQYEYWLQRRYPTYRIRNCGVPGQRTDEIAARLRTCTAGAKGVILEGGSNDIGQGRSVDSALANLAAMAKAIIYFKVDLGLVQVPPMNGALPGVNARILLLNAGVRRLGRRLGVPVFDWYGAVVDADGRFTPSLTDDGIHPTVEGYKLFAEAITLPLRRERRTDRPAAPSP